jgi:hypothetical protein
MTTATLSPNHVHVRKKPDSNLLLDPSALIGLLERERDALTRESKALRVGLDRLIESASASADMVLPMVAEDVTRCTQELSLAKGQLAMAVTGGCPEETLSALSRRKEALERDLEIARELLAEASRIAPLLDELRKHSGGSARSFNLEAAPVTCDVARAEQFFGIPASRVMPERKFEGSAFAAVRTGMLAKGQPLRKPTFTPPAAPAAPVAKPVEPVENVHLRSEPKPAQPSSTKPCRFGTSLFGKLFGR